MTASLAARKKSTAGLPFAPKVVKAPPNSNEKRINAKTFVSLAAAKMLPGTRPLPGASERPRTTSNTVPTTEGSCRLSRLSLT